MDQSQSIGKYAPSYQTHFLRMMGIIQHVTADSRLYQKLLLVNHHQNNQNTVCYSEVKPSSIQQHLLVSCHKYVSFAVNHAKRKKAES